MCGFVGCCWVCLEHHCIDQGKDSKIDLAPKTGGNRFNENHPVFSTIFLKKNSNEIKRTEMENHSIFLIYHSVLPVYCSDFFIY
jgi:hypothetical protein